MYLKSIEMQGFKSFANKILLEFHDGITGIVGPNGSGKSNVGDAVRWVLGEQSARQLRGGNMQDVIFSGTETRKPLGFASVAITLDNSDHQLNIDYEEVTVTRRLYRSGESEYLMNGKNCRLKDINELFYDTGIGKEGYSIIGQGQIDKILSGKPEERRELFDEAAGIVKFKRRKTATLKKLEEEQQNLIRVTDILAELSRQLGPLEKQSEKAKIYLQKKEELKNLDISLFRTESRRIETLLGEIHAKKDAAEAELKETEEALESARREYDGLQQQMEELEEVIRRAQEEHTQHNLHKQQLQGQIDVLREQIHAGQQNSQHYQESMNRIREDIKRRKDARTGLEEEQKKLRLQLQQAQEEEQAAEASVRELQDKIQEQNKLSEEGKNELIELLNRRSSVKGKMQRYDTMLEQIGIRKAELSQKMLHLKSDEALQSGNRDKLQEDYDRITEKVTAHRQQLQENRQQLEKLQKEIGEKNRQLEIGQTTFHRENSRLESLKAITERYDGYGNSIRKIMEQKDKNPGIHGVVADLIRTEQKYETAIETALGGSLQNIVTDNENTAKYLIEYLKRGHFGRATFLPLTSMNQDTAKNEKLSEEGLVGIAADLVECEPIYQGMVSKLLGRTWVVDTIDHAIAIGRKYRHRLRMVTLEGELLSPGGSMTGGAFRNTSSLLSRRREIEELERSVRILKREMETMTGEVEEERRQRNQLREEENRLSELLQKLYLEQNTAKMNLASLQEKTDSIRRDYQGLQREGREMEGQVAEISDSRRDIQSQMELSRQREEELNQAVTQAGAALDRLRGLEKLALAHQEEARLNTARIQQSYGFAQENIRSAQEDLRRLEEDQATAEANLAEEGKDVAKKEGDILAIQATIEAAEETLRADMTQLEAYRKQKEEMSAGQKTFFQKREELSDHKNLMDKECFRLNAQVEKQEEAREAAVAYLWEEYKLTPDQVENPAGQAEEEGQDRNGLKKQISGIKEEIRGLGPVNVNAIEEFRELQERHGFLSAQHSDLVKAAETLQGIIQELDGGMRRQFAEKFAQIRTEFDKVFKLLFGGGRGTLELMEEEDILEAGIRIISQPPGKKLQNMMQLSGGEKALTAIALLFAIQNLKPSPFCLLDEIEAALDDSNVGRFAKYLHKLTKNTQFIIITHRRGTMMAADRLYGITMQEKGVSTLVSVSLIEGELDK